MKIVTVSITGGKPYYVLLDADGAPLAQGSRWLVEAAYLSHKFNDTPAQASERLVFYGVLPLRLR